MCELSGSQIRRQDFVDNAVHDLLTRINPTDKEIPWNIELIAEVRETLRHVIVQRLRLCDEMAFYPFER